MAGEIWVLAEHWRGEVSDVTYELLALGRELSNGLGTSLEAVLLGHGAEAEAAGLGAADRVLYVDHPALAEPTGELDSLALALLAGERHPRAILVPITNVSWDLLGLVSARLGGSLLNFCTDVRASDEGLEATSLLFGGKMQVLAAPVAEPAVLGVLPGSRPADTGRGAGTAAIDRVVLDLPEAPALRLIGYEEPEAGDVDITQQEVLVAVGRGLQSDANLDLAEELAELLGGAVCGSRPAIDLGWLPMSRQVGKSGMLVKPRLYLALGISGAPEHVEGMKKSELVVAINSDPDAPIFNVAHYGVSQDMFDVVPVLIERARERKGA